jgi:tetratricopeptide (TPR) repeat protein
MLREMGVKRIEGGAVGNLAGIYAEMGRLEDARRSYERAIRILREAGDKVHEGIFLSQLGAVQAMAGGIEEATGTFGLAESVLAPIADEPLYESVALQRAHLDLALSRQAAAAGDHAAAQRYRAIVVDKLASVEASKPHVLRSDDVRVAVRMLRRALDQDATTGAASSPGLSIPPPAGAELVIGDEAREFRVPGGRKVILERRRAVRLILLTLVKARQEQPGVALPLEALLAAGWPGERVLPQAGASRVYVALGTLRRLGLRGLLISRDGGYLLDPKVPLRLVPALD